MYFVDIFCWYFSQFAKFFILSVNILAVITNTSKNYELSLRRLIWFVLKILKVFSCFFLYLSLISRLGGGNRGAPLSPWWWRSKEKESYFDAACHKHVKPGSSQLKVLFEHLAFIKCGLESLKTVKECKIILAVLFAFWYEHKLWLIDFKWWALFHLSTTS